MTVNYKILIYKTVQQIPKGKVSTYGKISEYLNNEIKNSKCKVQNYLSTFSSSRPKGNLKLKITPRIVGGALHNNPDPENIPCHRVVNKEGRIAENYAFGGWKEQRRILLAEGVVFRDKMHVDLRSCLHLLYCVKHGRRSAID